MTHHQEKLHAGEIKAKVVKGSENLAQVLLREPPRPASKRMLQFYCMIFLTFLCSTMNGYDGSLMSALLVMKPFLNEVWCKLCRYQSRYYYCCTCFAVRRMRLTKDVPDWWSGRTSLRGSSLRPVGPSRRDVYRLCDRHPGYHHPRNQQPQRLFGTVPCWSFLPWLWRQHW